MSYSLAITNGDIVLRGSTLGIVYGKNKLEQDLSLWLLEEYGVDRFHPNMGSTLQEYIGSTIDAVTRSDIHSEVLRVLQNYQAVQFRGLTQTPSNYSLSELLYSINDVQVTMGFDTVNVTCNVSNAEGHSSVIDVAQSVSGSSSTALAA